MVRKKQSAVDLPGIKTIEDFISEVEELVIKGKVDYLDAICTWCDRNKVEIETVAPIIKSNEILKSKVEMTAVKAKLITKSKKNVGSQLPF